MADMPLDNYKLAFEISSKALASQISTVDNARARIGLLMGSGNLATAFLGKDAVAHAPTANGVEVAFWIGAIAFGIFVLSCLYGLWPSGDWTFNLSARSIIARQESTPPESMEATYRYLATWQEQYFDENAHRLDKLFSAVQIASIAIAIELAAFLALAGGLKWIISI